MAELSSPGCRPCIARRQVALANAGINCKRPDTTYAHFAMSNSHRSTSFSAHFKRVCISQMMAVHRTRVSHNLEILLYVHTELYGALRVFPSWDCVMHDFPLRCGRSLSSSACLSHRHTELVGNSVYLDLYFCYRT